MNVKRDHPRSRGVYKNGGSALDQLHGSSPLARGLPRCYVERSHLGRIIPARAGFTCRQGGPSER